MKQATIMMALLCLSGCQKTVDRVEIEGPRHRRHAVQTQMIGPWRIEAWINGTVLHRGDAIDVGLRIVHHAKANIVDSPKVNVSLNLLGAGLASQASLEPVLYDCLELPAGHEFIPDEKKESSNKHCWQAYLQDPFRIGLKHNGELLNIGRYEIQIQIKLGKVDAYFRAINFDVVRRHPH